MKIAGWASIFDRVDDHGDVVRKGAFVDDLRLFTYRPILVGHDQKHIAGRWDHMEETNFGLWVEGELFAQDAIDMVSDKVIMGLSIGYNGQATAEPEAKGYRELKKVGLKEVSITPVPLNRHAVIMWTDLEGWSPWSKALCKSQVGGSTHKDGFWDDGRMNV